MKKRKLLLVLLLCATWSVFSQPDEQKNNRRLSLGLSFSPDYSSAITKLNNPDFPNFVKDYIEPDFGYTAGVNLSYQVNGWLGLEAGLHFANKGYKSSWIPSTNIQGAQLGKARYFDHFYYLDIPLTAKFYILQKRLRLFATAGLSPSIYLDGNYYFEIKYVNGEEKTQNSESPLSARAINLVMLAGLGIGYNISNKISLRLEPIYRRSLTSINSNPMKFYLWSIGVNAGMYYRL